MIGIGKASLSALVLVATVAGCSSSGASQSVAGATQASSAAASSAASGSASAGGYYGNGGSGSSASSAASGSTEASGSGGSGSTSGATVEAKSAGGSGTVLVAGSNGMTVYTFSQDVANSGKSNCSGGCASTWPPLTVSGGAPTAGSGVSGKLATIKRDDGSTQVTYNGLPLYFFSGDNKPGDTNGHYTGWNLVQP